MSDTDIHSKVEDAVMETLLEKDTDTAQYNITRFYGAFSAELFVEEIRTKLTTGKPAILVSCRSMSSERVRDTLGFVHLVTLQLEIVCASNIIKDKEFGVSRFTSLMAGQVKERLAGKQVVINDRNKSLVWSSDENLFRIENLAIDAQRMLYNIPGIMIYLTDK